ncbi:MAG TPA: hypothetical protein VNM48_22155 [Chloroflexota bacterium]|nr:hypothetical protein [Chloroflexota bacterium]
MAIEVAQAASVKRLALFHHAPTNNDTVVAEIEREAQAKMPSSFAAHEGLTISL